MLAREHLVQHDANAEQIGARIRSRAGNRLGRNVARRSEELATGRIDAPGNAEIHDLDVVVLAVLRQQDVFRLEVTVDETVGMSLAQREPNLSHDRRDGNAFRGTVSLAPMAIEPGPQTDPVHVFHDHAGVLTLEIGMVNRGDVRMLKARRADGFEGQRRRTTAVRARQHLDGHEAPQRSLDRFVDFAHASATDPAPVDRSHPGGVRRRAPRRDRAASRPSSSVRRCRCTRR